MIVGSPRNDENGTWAGAAQVITGDDHFLTISPEVANPGDTVTLDGLGGTPFGGALLVVTEVNDIPLARPVPLLIRSYDSAGMFTLAGPVGPDISNVTLTLQVLAENFLGNLTDSNEAQITIP